MHLSTVQHDRTAGVLLGQACGDALGVPYEFGTSRFDPTSGPRMAGGGLGGYAPGEWSDDTQMAVAVAQVAATGADLAGDEGLEQVAAGFLRWHADDPADIGLQTRRILADRPRHPSGRDHVALRELAADLHRRTGRTAGNGALMRTSVVGLTRLDDREATAGAARAVATLTHADPVAGDSCVLWSEAVRRAVLDGVLDVAAGLDLLPTDRRAWWAGRLEEAQTRPPETFVGNGWTVAALQAAWSAIWHTRDVGTGPDHVVAALHRAVGVGHDTDTVAAIAGGLLGARHGASALPFAWTRQVHGWPGLRARDLVSLAVRTAADGAAPRAGPASPAWTTGRSGRWRRRCPPTRTCCWAPSPTWAASASSASTPSSRCAGWARTSTPPPRSSPATTPRCGSSTPTTRPATSTCGSPSTRRPGRWPPSAPRAGGCCCTAWPPTTARLRSRWPT